MILRTEGAPASLVAEPTVEVGDVYAVEGGRGGPRFRVVVAVAAETAYCLVFRADGEVSNVDRCGRHYLERKRKVGRARVPGIDEVEWF